MKEISKWEWGVGITVTCVVILLLIVRGSHAGGLWRDECAALQLARMPTYGDVLQNFQFEAFPLLFPTTIRFYTNVFGTSNEAMRGFGLAVGILLISVLWLNAWLLSSRPPLLSLVLVGLNTTFLTWGTSVRGYGLGSVFILLAFGLFEKVRRVPTVPWIAAAFCASLAGVHCLLHNTVLLSAIGCSVLAVSLIRRELKPLFAVISIGMICVASMVFYIGPYSGGSKWNMLIKSDFRIAALWSEFLSALGATSPLLIWIWIVLLIAIATGAAWSFRRGQQESLSFQKGCCFFGLFVMISSLAGYCVFLKILSYVPRPWYFLALIVILAASVELIGESLARLIWFRRFRLLFIVVATVALPFYAWPQITKRQTNMDLVARKLELAASQNDLIVVTPWYFGVGFNWYYLGKAKWLTLPAIADVRTHRYDLLKEKMMAQDPIGNVMEFAGKALKSGNRIWIVGGVHFLKPGEFPVFLPPAPNSPYGWADPVYSETWSQQLGAFLQQHASRGEAIVVRSDSPVSEMENVPLVVVDGWRD